MSHPHPPSSSPSAPGLPTGPLEDQGQTAPAFLIRALAAATSGVIVTDATLPDNPIVYANQGFTRMTGYPHEEVLGRNCRFLQGQDTPREAVDQLRRNIGDGKESKVVLLNYRKDGSAFWNELSVSPVFEGDRVTHYIGVQTDVTDRMDAIRLQAALDFAESIYETARESLLILDPDHRVFRANRAFYRTFGTTREKIEGVSLYELGAGEWNIPALRELIEDILPAQNPFEDFEVSHEFPRIGKRTMHLNARRLEREGFPEFILLAIEDVTHRRRSEDEIAQRTEALVQRDRAKDEFLAMLSHELRNPLNALAGALRLAAPEDDASLPPDDPLAVASRQVENMSALIDDLLEVSRITQGKVEVKLQRTSLSRALSASLRASEAKLPDDGKVRILSDIPSGVMIDGDPLRLDQVFQNLLGNAMKFTPRGEIHVSLAEEGEDAVVRVRDTGIGIEPEVLPTVFELFRQGQRSLARSEGGLGIGLTIAQRLVTLHEGRVEVASEGAGRGTTFTVRFPRPAPPQVETEAPAAPVADAPMSGTKVRRKVLVVDDGRDSANMLAKLIQRQGHEARAVYHGDDVLPSLRGELPDLVFLDIGLPGKDGYEIAREIRADEELRGVRLVALTGYGQDSDRERAAAAGFDVHLLKPITLDAVRKALADIPPDADALSGAG